MKKRKHLPHGVGIVERGWRKNSRIERGRTIERLRLADHHERRMRP